MGLLTPCFVLGEGFLYTIIVPGEGFCSLRVVSQGFVPGGMVLDEIDTCIMVPISDMKKMIPNGTYASRELLFMLEGIIELNQFEIDDQVTKTNKLKGITEITLNLDELNNSDNLKDGRPSNKLLTYYVDAHEDFIHFKPQTP